jgi:alpha-N-arabinofuranosidase
MRARLKSSIFGWNGFIGVFEWTEDLGVQLVLAVYAGYSLKGAHIDAAPP